MFINRILERTKKIKEKEILLLIPILSLVCLLTFHPHFNYPYLFHVDEWFHVAQAKQVVMQSNTNWYTGENFSLGMERGWHGLLASIYSLFKPSIVQWSYLPTILHALATLSVFYFVFKLYGKNEALIASLLIALIPSNVTLGGPVFLVPINLSLLFIPLALIFAFRLTNIKPLYNYLSLFAITTFLLYTHPPTAVVLLTILGFYLLFNIFSKNDECRQNAKHLFFIIFISILFSIPNYLLEIQQRGLETLKFNFWVNIQGIPFLYGIIPTFFFVIGFYFLIKKENKETWSLLLTSIVLIINIIIFAVSGSTYLLPYPRTHIPLFLLMSIIAGLGYTRLLTYKKPQKIGVILMVICIIATTSLAINRNINTSYYQLIDDSDYEAFLWIKENTPTNATVLSDPWKARALAPVAERSTYAVMPFGPDKKQMQLVIKAINFFAENCINTTFLTENNIAVVYTTENCQNQNLIEIEENIYFLKTYK